MRLTLLLFVLWLPTAWATDLSCQVVAISDGDTFTCLTDAKQQVKVRMAEIDTPESKQPYGNRAQQALSGLIFGKTVALKTQEKDRYGRTVARVYVGSTDVNAELIKQGAAWVYRAYNKDKTLIPLEDQARKAKRGLWALPESERVAPWDWRKQSKQQHDASKATSSSSSSTSSTGFTCGSKTTCGAMSSCAEARFYLQQCGLTRLDRDGDGVPCESICR